MYGEEGEMPKPPKTEKRSARKARATASITAKRQKSSKTRVPSPSGRGCREAAGEGEKPPSSGPSLMLRPSGLALRAGHLLPEGEGLAPSVFAILDSCAPGGRGLSPAARRFSKR